MMFVDVEQKASRLVLVNLDAFCFLLLVSSGLDGQGLFFTLVFKHRLVLRVFCLVSKRFLFASCSEVASWGTALPPAFVEQIKYQHNQQDNQEYGQGRYCKGVRVV
ncbi:hypothetical protein [Ktedonobacter racemifer]|uniref:hypothetical protein n=1 Tax=Ktedonobacter racemifer TaxID=363277 RepID=UPI0012FC7457|nr:hypothetical protein [Ktedonobacter racemifer]